MTVLPCLIDAITRHVERLGTRPGPAHVARRWAAQDPTLAGYGGPAGILRAARTASPDRRDRLIGALLGVGGPDEWAELTVLAILAPRLCWVVARWARAGVPAVDLVELEADLVGECWAEIRRTMCGPQPPDRPGLALVDRAWATVRNRRATTRRRHHRHVPAPIPEPAVDGDPRTGPDLLAAAIHHAYQAGRLGESPARALFLTRVAGLSTHDTAEHLATSPGVVRAWRSRAATRLTAQGGLDERQAA